MKRYVTHQLFAGEIFRSLLLTPALLVILLLAPARPQSINNIRVTVEHAAQGQRQPKVQLISQTNDLLVIWADGRSDFQSLNAQWLTSAGRPKFSGGVPLLKRSTEIANFDFAIDAGGGVFIVWEEASLSNRRNVFITYIDANGNAWASPIQMGSATRNQSNPRVRLDDKGNAIVIWEDRPPPKLPILQNHGIGAQLFNRSGKSVWGDEVVIVVLSPVDQILEDVLSLGQAFVVAWVNTQDNKAYLRAFQAADGTPFSDAFIPTVAEVVMSRPRLALAEIKNQLKSSDVFVVWEEKSQIGGQIDLHAQKIDLTGGKDWSSDGSVVISQAGDQFNHDIVDDGNKNLFIVWQDGRTPTFKVYAQKFNSSGNRRFRNQGLALTGKDGNGNQINPKIVPNGDGGIYCVWEDDRNGTLDLYAQEIRSSGSLTWLDNGILGVPVSAHANDQRAAALVLHHDKRLGVVWEDYRDGDAEVFAQNMLPTGVPDNVIPEITSTPDTTAQTGIQYSYAVQAIDYDQDLPLSFRLVSAPRWLRIDPATGMVSGTPSLSSDQTEDDVKIEIEVADARGAAAAQSYVLHIERNNTPPKITSQPKTTAIEDQLYEYQLQVEDPDPGERHTFRAEQVPGWLALASDSGLLKGTPGNDDVGETAVSVVVQDAAGDTARQAFTLTVLNTNDPPFFTSTPDTFAVVDSLYAYQVVVEDIDIGDVVQISYLQGPGWATWNAEDRLLRGTPTAQHAGQTYQVVFEARDRDGATVSQRFRLHVQGVAAPDTIAPPPPAALFFGHSGWSQGPRLMLHWRTPTDASGIRAIFIKYQNPPTGNNDFDQRLEVSSTTGSEDSVLVEVPVEGNIAVYAWFEDGAGNADYRNHAMTLVKVDRTPPVAPVAVFPNGWSRDDTVRFVWRRATDTDAGIRDYWLTVGPSIFNATVTPQPADDDRLEVRLPLHIDGHLSKTFFWFVTATDSANNRASSDTLAFALDAAEPQILHAPLDTIPWAQPVTLIAEVSDRLSGVASVELRYRTVGEDGFRTQMLSPTVPGGETYTFTVPGTEIRSPGFEYLLIALDVAGNRKLLQTNSTLSAFRSVVVRSADLVAPQATRENRYQMVSVPYSVQGNGLQAFFEGNFGPYDDRQWRLLRWQEPGGYVELPEPTIEPLRPGRAYWLITRRSSAWKSGQVYSVSSAEKYIIPLQPGWNMVATPFAYDTPVAAFQLPAGVAANFWSFDGSGYRLEQTALRSWHGYFLENPTGVAQQIEVVPGIVAPTTPKHSPEAVALHWKLQIAARQASGDDRDNFLGAGTIDDLHTVIGTMPGEPPAIGHIPRLYFKVDFEGRSLAKAAHYLPPGDSLAWSLVVENLQSGILELDLTALTSWPDSLQVFLFDAAVQMRYSFQPGSHIRLPIQPGESRRDFELQVTSRKGGSQPPAALPANPVLHPVWPNPYRQSGNARIIFRFALTEPSQIELRIYNILGQLVHAQKAGAPLPAGEYGLSWNGQTQAGLPVASGVYLANLLVDGRYRLQRKFLIIE